MCSYYFPVLDYFYPFVGLSVFHSIYLPVFHILYTSCSEQQCNLVLRPSEVWLILPALTFLLPFVSLGVCNYQPHILLFW